MSFSSRLTLFLVALVLMGGLIMGQSETVSLGACLDEALKNNSQVKMAQQDLVRTTGLVMTARAALLPTVGSSAEVKTEDTDVFNQQAPPHLGFQDDWTVTVQLSQSIYSAGVNQNQLAIAKLQGGVATNQYQETINKVIFDTRKAYYDALLSQADILDKKQTTELLRKEVERQKSLFEAGRTTKFNILRTEVRLANELPSLEKAINDYGTAIFTLLNLMGRNTKAGEVEQLVLEGQLEVPGYPENANKLIADALSRSPELTRQEKSIEIDRLNARNARASLVPRLDFYAATRERQDGSQGSGFFENRNQSTVGILGSWNIFDGFAGKGNAIQFEANVRRGTIERESTARQIEYDIRKALLNLKQADASMKILAGNVQKARQSIELSRSSAEAGLSTQFDILQATVDLSDAQNIELRARYDYNVALAQLEKVSYLRLVAFGSEKPLNSLPVSSGQGNSTPQERPAVEAGPAAP